MRSSRTIRCSELRATGECAQFLAKVKLRRRKDERRRHVIRLYDHEQLQLAVAPQSHLSANPQKIVHIGNPCPPLLCKTLAGCQPRLRLLRPSQLGGCPGCTNPALSGLIPWRPAAAPENSVHRENLA